MVHTVTGHVINPAFYGKLPYDTERDFSSITLIASVPHMIVAHPSLPVKTLKDLIALAKARPGEINFASFGNGSTSHLSGELFNSMTGVKLVHIPYKGGGPALIDTLAGHVPLYFSSLPTSLPQVKIGKLRALAVTGATRSKQMPEMPTVDEAAGTKGYVSEVMYGVLAPAGVPQDIVRAPERRAREDTQDARYARQARRHRHRRPGCRHTRTHGRLRARGITEMGCNHQGVRYQGRVNSRPFPPAGCGYATMFSGNTSRSCTLKP